MGEFLLSILGYNNDGKVVFTRAIKYAKYQVGDLVPIYYPHKSTNKGKCKPYYRVFKKAIDPDKLHALLDSNNPDVYDELGFVPYQRELQDAEIFKLVSEGKDKDILAREMRWMPQAIDLAIHRHRLRVIKRKQAADAQAKLNQPQPKPAQPESKTAPSYLETLANWD